MSINLNRSTGLIIVVFLSAFGNDCNQFCLAGVLDGIRSVALLNDSFPNVSPAVKIEQFGHPRVDASGRVAFKARLMRGFGGTDDTNATAIWSEIELDSLRLVARQGDPVLSLNFTFDEVEPGEGLRMSAGGSTYFLAGISGVSNPTIQSSGVFRFSPTAGLEFLVASSPVGSGIPVAGTSGDSFSNSLDFNEIGDIAMQTGTEFGPIMALYSDTGVSSIAPSGSFPAINDNGDVVHRTGSGGGRIAVRNRSTSSRTVAGTNDIAPDTNGALFRSMGFENTFTNADGIVTFVARLSGAGIDGSNDFGIWSEGSPGGPVKLDLREGQVAEGVEAGVVWAGFHEFTPLTFGRSGGAAVQLGLTGPGVTSTNDTGVWAGRNVAELHLVAREADQAAGTEPGTHFDEFSQAGVTVDGRGVFFAYLSGSDPNRDQGLWAEGTDGTLRLIARTGDSIRLPNGTFAPLTSIQFSPQFGVSENGHVAFIGGFSGGRFGIFVSSAVAVPEPSVLLQVQAAILASGLIASACGRQRWSVHSY